jgi:hypothetical protein
MTAINEQYQPGNVNKISFAIMGFVFAAAYQITVPIVAIVVYSSGVTDSIRMLVLFAVGLLLSLIAYVAISNPSLKFGMRVYYGLVAGSLFLIGSYTILTSLLNL